MNQFYVSLIFIGIVLVSVSLIMILLDKKKAFSFISNYEKKKQELVEIIYDAEQMIEELNKFSDYVVTQMDFKNEELSLNLKKANEEIQSLVQKQQDAALDERTRILDSPQDAPETDKKLQFDASDLQIKEVAVNGDLSPGYKLQSAKSEKVIPINNKYNEVIRLHKGGMSELDIAKRLNMGKGEIQLILELNK